MSKKSSFIKVVKEIFDRPDIYAENYPDDFEDAKLYWEALIGKDGADKPMFTDNGKIILQYMKDHQDIPMWKARDIAEGLFIGSRAVSGAMRKLVTDGYVEKVGQDPVVYSLTESGKNIEIV